MQSHRKTAYLGLFAAAAILCGYVESLIPVFVTVPGIKLGIANLVTILVLYLYSWKEAALVSAIRIVVIGFMFGNLFSIAFSLAGAAVSMLVMILLKKAKGFSMTGVSVAGGVAHNIGQFFTAMALVETYMGYLLPILLVSGLITGFLVGVVAWQVYLRVEKMV